MRRCQRARSYAARPPRLVDGDAQVDDVEKDADLGSEEGPAGAERPKDGPGGLKPVGDGEAHADAADERVLHLLAAGEDEQQAEADLERVHDELMRTRRSSSAYMMEEMAIGTARTQYETIIDVSGVSNVGWAREISAGGHPGQSTGGSSSTFW